MLRSQREIETPSWTPLPATQPNHSANSETPVSNHALRVLSRCERCPFSHTLLTSYVLENHGHVRRGVFAPPRPI